MHRPFEGGAVARAVTGALVGATLCSCTAMQAPYVEPGDSPPNADFAKASEYARERAGELRKKLNALDSYDFRTSAVILASSVAGIGLAAYGAHADTLVGASLAGSAAYGARGFLPIDDRKKIYARGASAIACAVAVLGSKDLNYEIDATKQAVQGVDTAPLGRIFEKWAESLNSSGGIDRDAVSKTKGQATSFVEAANSVEERRATLLLLATQAVLESVNEQLIEARFDPQGATNALQSKAQTHTNSLRTTYENLEKAARNATDEIEDLEDGVDDKRSGVENVLMQLNTANGDGNDILAEQRKATELGEAKEALKENQATLDEVVASAARVLQLFDLESTCAAQP